MNILQRSEADDFIDGNILTNLLKKYLKIENGSESTKSQNGDEILNRKSFWNDYDVIRCPGDGHCFVHAFVKSYNSSVPSDKHIEVNTLLKLIQTHTEMDVHLYAACFENENELLSQMRKYVFEKCYKYLFGDIVILITAVVLKVQINFIDLGNTQLRKTEIQIPVYDCLLHRVLVLKTGSIIMPL